MLKTALYVMSFMVLLTACGDASNIGEPERGPNSQQRGAAFKTLAAEMEMLSLVVKGKTPYDVEKFKQSVATFAEKSQIPFQHLDRDGDGKDGKASAEMWTKPDEFKVEEDKFFIAIDNLSKAADSGNLEQIKPAFGTVGGSCKSCHIGFKL